MSVEGSLGSLKTPIYRSAAMADRSVAGHTFEERQEAWKFVLFPI